ncbi:MAG: glycosyltransferase family 4 protein [Rhodoferax sp.]
MRGRISGQLVGVHVNIAERLSLLRKGAIIIVCRALNVPVVLHLHAHFRPFYRALPHPLQAFVRWIFSLPSCCVVLGNAAQRFVTEELRVPAERVEIVFNGVPEPVEIRRKVAANCVRRVLFLGRLSELKGVPDLLRALALPGFDRLRLEVTLAGGGDIQACRAEAEALNIDSFVHFEGWLDQQKVACLMAGADVLVLPSYVEVLPLAVLEALANGVAVVCTPVGEIPSVLTDGVNACFVQPGDVQGLAASLQRVLGQPALMESLERSGRALYEEKFSLARFFGAVACIHRRYFGIAGEPLPATRNIAKNIP